MCITDGRRLGWGLLLWSLVLGASGVAFWSSPWSPLLIGPVGPSIIIGFGLLRKYPPIRRRRFRIPHRAHRDSSRAYRQMVAGEISAKRYVKVLRKSVNRRLGVDPSRGFERVLWRWLAKRA